MSRVRHTLAPIVAYHGCDHAVAEQILAGTHHLRPSKNDYDWLGPGVYFWVDSQERAWDWAHAAATRKAGDIKQAAVVGAFIHPSLCLNLTDYGVMSELLDAHSFLVAASAAAEVPLPQNTLQKDGVFLKRGLDCAVINAVHRLREDQQLPAYDSVYGVFEEGKPLYANAGFKTKTHVQIAVRNSDCIVGYFRCTTAPNR